MMNKIPDLIGVLSFIGIGIAAGGDEPVRVGLKKREVKDQQQ
jgi:hypothetical protein